jgi:chloramphenicol-sensitive protein RarD
VLVLTIAGGEVPVVALVLTVSFGLYGFFRKTLPLGANQGFLLEVVLLSPAGAGLADGDARSEQLWRRADGYRAADGCGVVTAVPLDALCQRGQAFAAVDHRHPAIHRADDDLPDRGLLFGGTVRHCARMIAFPMIWAALVIYTVSLWRGRDRGRDHVRA